MSKPETPEARAEYEAWRAKNVTPEDERRLMLSTAADLLVQELLTREIRAVVVLVDNHGRAPCAVSGADSLDGVSPAVRAAVRHHLKLHLEPIS